jgi:hypothetical protein
LLDSSKPPNGFALGHVTVKCGSRTVSSSDYGAAGATMIVVAATLFLDGVGRLRNSFPSTPFQFVCPDSSFTLEFELQPNDMVDIRYKGKQIGETPLADLLRAVLDGAKKLKETFKDIPNTASVLDLTDAIQDLENQ